KCNEFDGRLIIENLSGGHAPYFYSLNNIAFFTDSLFKNLKAGSYTIFSKDANECIVTDTVTIADINGPAKVWISKTDALCGASYGYITIDSVSGGIAPFTYSINNTDYSSNTNAQNIAPGSNFVLAKDKFGYIFK